MSTYYVLLLSDDYIVRSIYFSSGRAAAVAFYNNEISTDFTTTHAITIELFELAGIITLSRLLYADMTLTQKTNISAYGFVVVQFIMIEVPPPIVDNDNIVIGNRAGNTVGNLGPLLAVGRSAGQLAQKTNTLVGHNAGSAITTGAANCCLGSAAGTALTTTYSNTLIGEGVGVGYIGSNGICVGSSTTRLGQNTQFNVVMGAGMTGFSLSTGSRNILIGGSSGFQLSTGSDNVIIGNSGGQQLSTGANNVCIGASARAGTTGNGNIVIGRSAGTSLTTGSNNICIASAGAVAETGVIRIGTNGTHAQTFLQGVYGKTVPSSISVAISPAGELGTIMSSRRYKKNIQPLNRGDLIYKLQPVSFSYNNEDDSVVHYGLIAEDVYDVDPDMVIINDGSIETVKYESLAPLLIDTIQQLNIRINELTKINDIHSRSIVDLTQTMSYATRIIDNLTNRISELETQRKK